MRLLKEKFVTISYRILPDGSIQGAAMFRHRARKEKIQRLFK